MIFVLWIDSYPWFQIDLCTCADPERGMSGLSGCLKEEAMGLLPLSQEDRSFCLSLLLPSNSYKLVPVYLSTIS